MNWEEKVKVNESNVGSDLGTMVNHLIVKDAPLNGMQHEK